MDSYVEVCPSSGVNVQDGRVMIGPCYRVVNVFYRLMGVSPIQTISPDDGKTYFVPRANTFRTDGDVDSLVFFNNAGNYQKQIRLFPCSANAKQYGVDVFAFTPQVITVTSIPPVPVAITSEQAGTQQKHQLLFSTDASVFVTVSSNANGRAVTLSVDMSAPIAAGTHSISDWVEVRGSFNSFGGGDIYRLTRTGNIYTGTFPIVGAAGSTVAYKFFGQRIGFEPNEDRTLVLGPAQVPQSVGTVLWGATNPNGRIVSFSVDMSAPIAAGTHSVGDWVEVRGSFNSFGGGEAYRLARNGNIYSGSFQIVGNAGSTVTYKFYGQRITWEPGADRSLVLGPVQVAQTVPAAVWNV